MRDERLVASDEATEGVVVRDAVEEASESPEGRRALKGRVRKLLADEPVGGLGVSCR